MANIGKMDKRITIIKPMYSSDGMGGRKSDEIRVATVWAEFLRARIMPGNIQGAPAIQVTQQIRIRRTSTDIKRNMLVIYKYHKYNIIFVEEKKDEILLTCQEVEK